MSDTAVLVIDMLNAYRHEDAELLAPNVAEIIDPMVGLISVARERDDVDLIYVNDNYGDFNADHEDIVRSALRRRAPGSGRADRARRGCAVPPEGPAQRLLLHGAGLSAWAAGNQAADPDGAGHRAMHPLHGAGRLHPPFHGDGAAGCGRPHRSRPGARGVADDGAQHASRDRARGEVPGLTRAVTSCWPAVRPQAPRPIRRFSLDPAW